MKESAKGSTLWAAEAVYSIFTIYTYTSTRIHVYGPIGLPRANTS